MENGADPNFYAPDFVFDCVLWDLQYPSETGDDEKRLKIAQLFFEYGAAPNYICENESLFHYVGYKVYNEVGSSDWDYVCRFFLILLAYGGGDETGCYKPENMTEIDKAKISEYKLSLFAHGDGYHVYSRLVLG